jgi:carbon monoxide dehydrogenase subunit G
MDNPNSESTSAPSCCGKFSWFKKALLALVVVIAALSVVIAMQPSDFKVARTATFNAPPAAVFEQVNDFHKWEAWSPWAKLDPNAKNTFEGPSSGEGAIFRWDGDSNVGEGSMELVESKPNELIRIKLDFVRPMPGTNDIQFLFEPEGEGTKVTWSMAGEKNFLAKAFGLVMDCEKMCGDMFDEGFAGIKKIVEGTQNEPTS